MSLSKLTKLPPEVLSSVLNNRAMPLRRRLRLRFLSNRWADIIEDGLKKETSLVVRDEDDDYPIPEPDDLIIQSTDPTDEFIRPLSRLFTSLTQLSISFGVEASWSKIPSLLGHLDTTNLATVKLYGFVEHDELNPIAIAAALTALPAITSLTLDFAFSADLLPHLKSVLSRLEKFGFSTNYTVSVSIISSSLSPRCTHLWLDYNVMKSFKSPFLVQLSSHLTHLHLLNCNNTIWQYISQLYALSSLTLGFTYVDLDSSFFSHLRPLTRLTKVKLLHLKYRAPLALPSKKKTPLSSIKRLTLDVDFGDSLVDYQAFLQTISVWFSNLGSLTILTEQDTIPAIRASLGKLPFSVEIVDRKLVDTWAADW